MKGLGIDQLVNSIGALGKVIFEEDVCIEYYHWFDETYCFLYGRNKELVSTLLTIHEDRVTPHRIIKELKQDLYIHKGGLVQ